MLTHRTRRASEAREVARGYALVTVVVVVAVLLVVAASTIVLTRTELHSAADQTAHQQAFYIAEAGVQRGIAQLDWERAMASTYTTYSYAGSSESFGDGSYVVSIAQDSEFPTDPTRKLITSTGTKGPQTATVVAHVVVQPVSASSPPSNTPTTGPNTTPTVCGNPTPTPPRSPPTVSSVRTSTRTPGPAPTATPGVPACMPTATATPAGTTELDPCGNHEILVSYNGTAKIIDDVSALSKLVDGNGKIFSNNDVTFDTDLAVTGVGCNASGTGSVFARGSFNNTGTALLSTLSNVNLYRAGSYNAAAGDTHDLLGGCVSCVGFHFANGSQLHGASATISKAYPWRPDYARYKRFANVIVNKHFQPFGSWDNASNTWVTGGCSFPAGTRTLYYVEGNVKMSGVTLFHTAAPRIVARGWISMTTLTVVSSGLLATDVQRIDLIGERDVMIGRDVVDMTTPTFQSESTALSLGQGVSLATAVNHTLNLKAISERGSVWAMTSNLSASSTPRMCLLGGQDATLAFTGTVNSAVLPLY